MDKLIVTSVRDATDTESAANSKEKITIKDEDSSLDESESGQASSSQNEKGAATPCFGISRANDAKRKFFPSPGSQQSIFTPKLG